MTTTTIEPELAKLWLNILCDSILAGTTDASEDGSFTISHKEGQAVVALFATPRQIEELGHKGRSWSGR